MAERSFDEYLPRLSEWIARAMGLHFPSARWADLRRGVAGAAKDLGFADAVACAQRLLTGPICNEHLEVLANHLTVGETYFFREQKSFELLKNQIIPELMRARAGGDRRLRLWSAACCTGEEAYSLAICLHQTIPDLAEWNVMVLATDINTRFLRKAAAGVYGPWSFRDVPLGIRECYFRPAGENRWEVLPHIKQLVHFAPLNLVEDAFPALASETNAMDVIFCRNVLMYFKAEQAHKVIENLHRAQVDAGWLIVGHGELSQMSSTPYAVVSSLGGTHYRKFANPKPAPREIVISETSLQDTARWPLLPAPILQIGIAAPAEAPAAKDEPESAEPQTQADLHQTAINLANRGRLVDALSCCDRWLDSDRLNPSGHYLRAVILQEQGAIEDAIRALRGALFLDPNLVLAHFALGNIERNRGRAVEAKRHLKNARRLLRRYRADTVLPESEGITAGRFGEIVESLLELEAAA